MNKILGLIAASVLVALMIFGILKWSHERTDYEKDRASWEEDRDSLTYQISIGRLENQNLIDQLKADSAAQAPVLAEIDTLQSKVARERADKLRALAELEKRRTELAVAGDTSEMGRIAGEAIVEAQKARSEADTLGKAVTRLRTIVDEQTRAQAALMGRLQETQARADSCIELAERAPVYRGERILGIKLPSRSTSLAIGGVAGTLLGFVLASR